MSVSVSVVGFGFGVGGELKVAVVGVHRRRVRVARVERGRGREHARDDRGVHSALLQDRRRRRRSRAIVGVARRRIGEPRVRDDPPCAVPALLARPQVEVEFVRQVELIERSDHPLLEGLDKAKAVIRSRIGTLASS